MCHHLKMSKDRRWDKQLARAERELAKNRIEIEQTPRGTTSQKVSDLGKKHNDGKQLR